MVITPEDIIPAIRRGECRKVSMPGFVNASYFADQQGNIYSLNNPREPKAVEPKMGNGLMWVTLFEKEGYIRKMMVGEVIANTFMGEADHDIGTSTVIYLDGDTSNNAIDNLRWGTHQEQQNQLRRAHFEQRQNGNGREKPAPENSRVDNETSVEVPFVVERNEDPLLEQMHLLQERLEASQLREAELINALQPFARFELSPRHAADMGNAVVLESNRGSNNHSMLSVQHFRVAKKVLSVGAKERKGAGA